MRSISGSRCPACGTSARGAPPRPRSPPARRLHLRLRLAGARPDAVTTIAWRLAHLQVGVFGQRAASHFGGPPIGYETYDYPGDAATALSRLDAAYAAWAAGVRALDPEGRGAPSGRPKARSPPSRWAALILHINREALHHGAEISLLRDLYRWRSSPTLKL